jgi:hypothetical protein
MTARRQTIDEVCDVIFSVACNAAFGANWPNKVKPWRQSSPEIRQALRAIARWHRTNLILERDKL